MVLSSFARHDEERKVDFKATKLFCYFANQENFQEKQLPLQIDALPSQITIKNNSQKTATKEDVHVLFHILHNNRARIVLQLKTRWLWLNKVNSFARAARP